MAVNSVCGKLSRELAMKLRSENLEQFRTLVRMHLSFEMDLNTEENEEPEHHEKGIFKKFNKFSKKTKPHCTTKANSPECDRQTLSKDLIARLGQIMGFLTKEESLVQEGIFRRTGNIVRQNELKNLVLSEKQDINLGEFTVHDCASVLKGILSDLPEPLCGLDHYSAYMQLAELYNNNVEKQSIDDRLTNALQLLLLLLPPENRDLLENILRMLNETTLFTDKNKMNADTLSTLFTPHLVCPRKLSPESLHSVSMNMRGVVSFMILKGNHLFDIPPKLNTDIRMYFVELKRKKTKSPEMILDESMTSDSTAATVYTFIDRQKTAQAHDSNPTDTALAQLYAHIQSLPESNKKKKLIKQFNKENGHGTPLQLLMFNRMKHVSESAKHSFSDSIKKHIFSRSLLAKTPKRNHCTPNASNTPTGFSTLCRPMSSVTNQIDGVEVGPSPKKRVLFQSPLHPSDINKSSKWHAITNHNNSVRDTEAQDKTRILIDEEETPPPRKLEEQEEELTKFSGRKFRSEPNLSMTEVELGEETLKNLEMRKLRVSLSYLNEGLVWLESKKEDLKTQTSLNETGSFLLDERYSMSPITKSTQRMPKYMQESIMTPRSRKPVMLLGLNLGNSSTASNVSQAKSFEEEESLNKTKNEEASLIEMDSIKNYNQSEEILDCHVPGFLPDSLSNNFREYLTSRSVWTEQPTDLSFSSQPDDFGSSLNIQDLNESEMTQSMLYCLDGNEPEDSLEVSQPESEKLYRKRSSEMMLGTGKECQIKKIVLENTSTVGDTSSL